MPKILQINTVVNTGSTGRICEEIGLKIITNEWVSYIAYGRNEKPSKSKLIKIGTLKDVYLHVLKSRIFDRHGFESLRPTINFINKIENIKPDIIHIHNLHGYYINIEVLFNYLASTSVPVVWTLHDCWPFTGHCTYFDLINCNRWKTGCYDCPNKNEYPASYFFDNSKTNYSNKYKLFTSIKNLTIVPVSNWLGNIVKESFLNKYKQHLIYNGVNLEIFAPKISNSIKKNLGIDNRFILLGVASIWNSRKGLEDYISLSKLIKRDCVIVLVGLKEKQIKRLPSNIIGISRTENIQELAELYSAADLFLNLTYEDNFPTTNLESLACGTPVLTYNTGGSVEAVDDKTGFIVEKGDLNAVIDAIKLVEEKGKVYYSSACRERAISLYNKEDRFNEYIQLYNEILNKK